MNFTRILRIWKILSRWRLKVKRIKKVSWPAKTTDDWAILIVFVNSSEKKKHKDDSKKSDRE